MVQVCLKGVRCLVLDACMFRRVLELDKIRNDALHVEFLMHFLTNLMFKI